VISTAVEHVYQDYGKPEQKALERLDVAEAKRLAEEGQFAPGSMQPKIQASVEFVEATGREALITDPGNVARAVAGETGTLITP